MELSKRKIVICLALVGILSIGLKLYLIDFSLPFNSDNLGYTLRAIAHVNGDFSQVPHKGIGWSLFLSPFFYLLNPPDLIDYSNIVRILSISIATISIVPVYLVGRKFFDQKYSLVVASLLAFEPHLNYNSGLGLVEPLYHLLIIVAFYFILSDKTKFIIPSLALAGICWWMRINGLVIFFVITLIYFITQRKNPNLFRNYFLGFIVFLIIVSPMLIQRYDQFGDPFYFWYEEYIFAGDYEMVVSKNIQDTNPSAFDYIQKNGTLAFFENFILKGIYNILDTLARISFPYLLILLPFGIMFSFRAFDQNPKFIQANWIFILASLALIVITFSIVPERRYLFFLYPFLIIFSTIPIQRIAEYGLSTFSFTVNQKNMLLTGVVGLFFIISLIFTITQFERPDLVLENEKIELAKFISENLEGTMLDESGPALEYVSYVMISEHSEQFKNYKIKQSENDYLAQTKLERIYIYATSIEELVREGKEYDLKYIVSNKNEIYFHKYVDRLYNEENKYPYLTKIFDSQKEEFQKLHVKIFEIDYDKFEMLSK